MTIDDTRRPTPDARDRTVRTMVPLDGAIDLVRTCRPLTDGGSDPTWHISPTRVCRALTTPAGPATVEVTVAATGLEVLGTGPGAGWCIEQVPRMLGLHDDPAGFEPRLHPLVDELARRHPGARFGASLRLWDAIAPVVLGQRVTVGEARRSWWLLVRRHGRAAPGHDDLFLPPTPGAVARLGIGDWHSLGVDKGRAVTIQRLVPLLPALERAAQRSSEEFQRVITTVPGVGPWTATALASAVLGDPDAVLLGDLHLPNTVSWALAGEPRGSDERMLELLEPWKGHRGRVVRLLKGGAIGAPRRGPRYTPIPIGGVSPSARLRWA